MTIESLLEAQNAKLDTLISLFRGGASTSSPEQPPVSNDNVAPGADPFSSQPAAGTSTASPPAAEPPKRGRGRPAKGETPVATPAASSPAPTVQAAADFLSLEPAPQEKKQVTLNDVRAALAVFQTKSGQQQAIELFKANSGGAESLAQLKPDAYYGVFKAALPAEKFDLKDVREVLVAANARVADSGLTVLKANGANNITEVKPEKFVDVILAAYAVK